MTKLLSALSLCLLLAHPAFSQIANDRNQHRLKGAIQSARVEVSRVSDKEGKAVESPRVLSSEYTFDASGQLIESIIYNYDGSLYAKYRARYDDKGNKLEEAYFNPKGELADQMIFTYDPNGRLIEKVVEKASATPKGKFVYTYDERGRITEKVYKDINDTAMYKMTYAYDGLQNKIEETAYSPKGTLINKTTHKYDSQMRLAERESYFIRSSEQWKTSFTYDANGNVAEETFNIFDAVSKWRYEYELDSDGNWTKRITYSQVNKDGALKFAPVEIAYRTITYNAPTSESRQSRPMDLSSAIAIGEMSSHFVTYPIKRQEPVYPEEAKRQRMAGKVSVFIIVDESGEVISARTASEVAKPLRDAATAAAWRWKFNPSVSGGIPVRFVKAVAFNFNP